MPVPNVRFTKSDTSSMGNKTTQKRRVFYSGYFTRGIPNKLTPVYSILDLKIKFGKPDENNLDEWFQIYNYFEYGNREIVLSRIIGENSFNSSVSFPFDDFKIRIDDFDEFETKPFKSDNNFLRIIARNPGKWGDDLTISIFTNNELKNNRIIFNEVHAKELINHLSNNEYCICVFYKKTLVEQFKFEKSVEYINRNSKYIFISFEPWNHRYYDGNTMMVDGLKELADGNMPTSRMQVFYGDNSLKLSGGSETLPSIQQIYNSYMDVGESDEYIFDFILANNKFANAAIDLADKRADCCALIGIPRHTDAFNFVNSLTKSSNAIVYYGYKLMRNIFTDKNIFVNCVGDVLGLRTYLINNKDLSSSHCKAIYNFRNYIDLEEYLNEEQIRDYYNSNINIIKKGYIGAYALSENMLNSEKLTNKIIYYNLVRDCENVVMHFIFEHNDELTRNDLSSKIKSICRSYVSDNNIEDFKVICDLSNNPNPDNNLYVDIYYKPKYLVEEIVINLQAVSNLN